MRRLCRSLLRFAAALLMLRLCGTAALAYEGDAVDNLICDEENRYALRQSEAMPGEILHFRSVSRLRGGDMEYVLLGQLSEELTFLGLEGITIKNAALNASYYTLLHDPEAEGIAFEIHVSSMGVPPTGETELTVAYSARLDTVPANGAPVTAGICVKSGRGEYVSGEAARITAHSIELFRAYSSEGKLRALSGAGFSLFRDAEQEDRLRFVKATDGRYILCSAVECGHTHHEYVLRTTDTGSIRLDGLISGVYYLQETRPPRGYEPSAENEVLTITRSGRVYLGGECSEDGVLRLITAEEEGSVESEITESLSLYRVGYPLLVTALLAAVLDYRRLCRMIASLGR